jgi:hypothetical protein
LSRDNAVNAAGAVGNADDVVLKRSGPAALVSKVVALFRRP